MYSGYGYHGKLSAKDIGNISGAVMNKQEIYSYLKDRHIWYEVTEHTAVYNMEELSKIALPYPEQEAKNLFVRDDKKENYYLITVKGSKRVDLKAFKKGNGTRPLCFASEEELMRILQLTPGSVTPFGIFHDRERSVHFYIDREFLDAPHFLGVHPNENTATVWIKTQDLADLIREHGNSVDVADI